MYGLFNLHQPPKIRSLLSPGQRSSVRSLSSTDASLPYNSSLLKIPMQKPKQENSKTKSNLSLFQKNEGMKTKNTINKCAMNRCQFMFYEPNCRTVKDSESLHVMVRQMKQKIVRLEKQNLMLKQQQVEDIRTIQRQNGMIVQFQKIAERQSFQNPKHLQSEHRDSIPNLSPLTDLSCWCCADKGKENKSHPQGMINTLCKLKEERDQLKNERDLFKEETHKLTKEQSLFREERQKFKIRESQLKEERDQLRKERDQLTEERNQLKKERNQIRKSREQLKQETEELSNKLRDKDEQICEAKEAYIQKSKTYCMPEYLLELCRQKNDEIERIDSILGAV